jgi:hypothetical protein
MRKILVAILLAAATSSAAASAQRRPAGSAAAETRVGTIIMLNVGGASYNFSGQATCERLAGGSIYDIPADRWSVQQADGARSLSLNLWRPGAGDMVTLSISSGGKRYDVDTVKSPRKPQTTGTANVKFAPQGNGGTFTIDATAGGGAKITGTIKCDAFTTSTPVAG